MNGGELKDIYDRIGELERWAAGHKKETEMVSDEAVRFRNENKDAHDKIDRTTGEIARNLISLREKAAVARVQLGAIIAIASLIGSIIGAIIVKHA